MSIVPRFRGWKQILAGYPASLKPATEEGRNVMRVCRPLLGEQPIEWVPPQRSLRSLPPFQGTFGYDSGEIHDKEIHECNG